MTETEQGVRTLRLAKAFVELSACLTEEVDTPILLQAFADGCAGLLSIASVGASVTIDSTDGVVVAASDERASLLELVGRQDGRSPAGYVRESGLPLVNVRLLGDDGRWPTVAHFALELGLGQVTALPLRARGDMIGVVCLYCADWVGLDSERVAIGQSLADVAAGALVTATQLRSTARRAQQLQSALDSRVIIEQAKGRLAERWRVTPEEAFQRLRKYARSHNTSISGISREIAESPPDGRSVVEAM